MRNVNWDYTLADIFPAQGIVRLCRQGINLAEIAIVKCFDEKRENCYKILAKKRKQVCIQD